MNLVNHLEKKAEPKNRKKNQSEIAACEQKTTSEFLFKHRFLIFL